MGIWLFYAAVNGELKAAAAQQVSSGDRMDAKRRPSSIESRATEDTELIENHLFNAA